MMVNVPKSLKGGTLGQAHKWARSQSDSLEYILENPSGKKVSLADLITGSLSEVNIVSTRKNPAHPVDFEPVTYGMNRNVNLTHILPEEVSPALVSAMVQNEGLFGAVQSLSILLNREITEGHMMTPGAMAILAARTWSPDDAPVDKRLIDVDTLLTRPNPAPVGIGRSMGGRILGQEIAEMDKSMEDWVKKIVTTQGPIENNIDMGQIETFVRNVLTPYLLASESNKAALQYISTYVLPAVNEHTKKDLGSEFKYMAEHMATNPKDFYYGKTNAILAHPGFLFPHYGVISLQPPVGNKKTDKEPMKKIEALMLDAGNPPMFDGNKFIPRSKYTGAPPVEYLNMAVYGGTGGTQTIDWNFLMKSMKKLGRGGGMDFLNAVSAATDETRIAETVEEPAAYVEAFKRMSKKQSKTFIKDLTNKPVLFIMDLPGMRPRPINWPDKMVMAGMEVLAKHRGFERDTPLSWRANDFLHPQIETFHGTISFETQGEKFTVDFDDPNWAMDLSGEVNIHLLAGVAIGLTEVFQDLMSAASASGITSYSPRVSRGISLVNVIQDTVSLSISKYGYEPTDEDIKMLTAIMLTAISEMDAKSGYLTVETLADKLSAANARMVRGENKKARDEITAGIAAINAGGLSRLDKIMALRALRKALERL